VHQRVASDRGKETSHALGLAGLRQLAFAWQQDTDSKAVSKYGQQVEQHGMPAGKGGQGFQQQKSWAWILVHRAAST
jgi:hypothetical protein